MKHDWYLDEDGEIDVWRMEYGYHNGPGCRRCEKIWCQHCEPEIWDQECPSSQLDLPLEGLVQ